MEWQDRHQKYKQQLLRKPLSLWIICMRWPRFLSENVSLCLKIHYNNHITRILSIAISKIAFLFYVPNVQSFKYSIYNSITVQSVVHYQWMGDIMTIINMWLNFINFLMGKFIYYSPSQPHSPDLHNHFHKYTTSFISPKPCPNNEKFYTEKKVTIWLPNALFDILILRYIIYKRIVCI